MHVEKQKSIAQRSSDEQHFQSATIGSAIARQLASKLSLVPLVIVLLSGKEPAQGADNTRFAQPVTLEWDASPDSSVVGYRVYYGDQSGSYTNSFVVGPSTTATLTNLVPDVDYFFAATCYDADGAESPFSNELKYRPSRLPIRAPQGLRVSLP